MSAQPQPRPVRETETAQVDEANTMGRSPVVLIHGARTAGRQQGLSVATKLLRILGAFSVDRPRLRASDVHRRSGLPYSTVYRLLNELVSHGVLEHQPDGTYTVGIRLWEVAAVNPELRSLRRWALPRMYELCSAFRCSVYLDVPVGVEALCLEELSAVDDDDTRRHGPGSRFPLDSTTGGQILLFHAGPEVVETYLAAPSAARGSADRLRQALAYIGRTGVAVDASDRISVAAPVFDRGWRDRGRAGRRRFRAGSPAPLGGCRQVSRRGAVGRDRTVRHATTWSARPARGTTRASDTGISRCCRVAAGGRSRAGRRPAHGLVARCPGRRR